MANINEKYEAHQWKTGQVITADSMNKIENEISHLSENIKNAKNAPIAQTDDNYQNDAYILNRKINNIIQYAPDSSNGNIPVEIDRDYNKIWVKASETPVTIQVPDMDDYNKLQQATYNALQELTEIHEPIQFKTGYISTNITPIQVNEIHALSPWRYAVVPCSQHDKFKITAQGGATARAYTFTTSAYERIGDLGPQGQVTQQQIEAPARAAWLILNDKSTTGIASKIIGSNTIQSKITTLEQQINNIANDSYICYDVAQTVTQLDTIVNNLMQQKYEYEILDQKDPANKINSALSYTDAYLNKGNSGAIGGIGNGSSIIWWYHAASDETVYLTTEHKNPDKLRAGILEGGPYQGSPDGDGRVVTTVVTFNQDSFPTATHPWTVKTGQYLTFSLYNESKDENRNFKLYRAISKTYEIKDTMSLTTQMDTEVDEKISSVQKDIRINQFPSEHDLPINVAHRGLATSGFPENTMPAFKDAVSKGWKYIETDIRKTQDGVWVLLHDSYINKVARGTSNAEADRIYISDITYEQAFSYDYSKGADDQFEGTKICTLDAFLNFCNKQHIYPMIEVKDSQISQSDADAVWEIVCKYGMQDRCLFTCSSYGGVKFFLEKNPRIPCVQTGSGDWQEVDISALTPESNKPYAANYQTGYNKVFAAKIMSGMPTKELMDNCIDYYHYFGIYAAVYCPTTTEGIASCSDRFDMCTSQYVKYSDVKADSIEY